MKSTLKLAALALTVSLAACGDSNTSTSSSTTSSDSNADTRAMMSATPATSPDSGSGMAANGAANNGMSDQDFVTKASSMNVAEIAAHKAAQAHAMSADVKMHAQHMLADHTKMGDEMKALASKKNMTVSNDPPADKKQAMDDLNSKKGKDFDATYINQQIKDHEEAISLFESGSKSVKDPDLKALIDKTLPTLHKHLQMVQDAQSKLNK